MSPAPGFVELVTTSNFTFLQGGSHPEELVVGAAHLGLSGLGICDVNSLAGVVRGHVAVRDLAPTHPQFRYLCGTRLVFADGTPDIVAYPKDRKAYGHVCHLLTTGNRRAKKGACTIGLADLKDHLEGLLLIVMPPRTLDGIEDRLKPTLVALKAHAPGRVWLGANAIYDGADRARINRLAALAASHAIPLLATNDVLYHTPERRPLQDVVTCIREPSDHRGCRAGGWKRTPSGISRPQGRWRDCFPPTPRHWPRPCALPNASISRSTICATIIPPKPWAMARPPSRRSSG